MRIKCASNFNLSVSSIDFLEYLEEELVGQSAGNLLDMRCDDLVRFFFVGFIRVWQLQVFVELLHPFNLFRVYK